MSHIPVGYILLTIVRRKQDKVTRFRASSIDMYVEDTTEHPFLEVGDPSPVSGPIGSYVIMNNGTSWSVKESPEEIDRMIDLAEYPPSLFDV